MFNSNRDFDRALTEVSASSAGGAAFLAAFGASFLICAALSFFLPVRTAALAVMFQGSAALPLAFWLERRLGSQPMSANNPLRPLSVQMAMSQIVALPAVIIAFSLNPATVPAALAAVGGGHFLPYAWLQRTRIYFALGVAISLGAFVLQIILQAAAFPWILMFVGAAYWTAAPLVYRNAARLVRAEAARNQITFPDLRQWYSAADSPFGSGTGSEPVPPNQEVARTCK